MAVALRLSGQTFGDTHKQRQWTMETGDPVSKATDRTWQTITSITPSGFGSETADVVLWNDGEDLVVRRPLGVKGYQELELESIGSI